jgi:multidrug efflux pump subunit AcrA (membrane-fusion protein)
MVHCNPYLSRSQRFGVPANVLLGAIAIILFCPNSVQADDAWQAENLIVIPIETVEVPASRSGRLAAILAKPGDQLSKGDLIGRLDDRNATLSVELATNEFEVAKLQSSNQAAIAAASALLAGEEQAAKQRIVQRKIANLKAGNELRVFAAQKSAAVAENEYRRASESRKQYAESVSKSEIESLKLLVEKGRLETRQAEMEKEIAELEAKVEAEAAVRQTLTIKQAEAELLNAKTDASVAALQLQNRRLQVDLAQLVLQEHRIVAPIGGRLTRILKSPGSWVNEGESVAKIVRLDRLRLEGFLPVDRMQSVRLGSSVQVSVSVTGKSITRDGEVSFIDPEIDPVSGDFRYWIDFDNADVAVLPGMRGNARTVRGNTAAVRENTRAVR